MTTLAAASRNLWRMALLVLPFNMGLVLWQNGELSSPLNAYSSFMPTLFEGILALTLLTAVLAWRTQKNKLRGSEKISMLLIAMLALRGGPNALHIVAALGVYTLIRWEWIPFREVARLLTLTMTIQVGIALAQTLTGSSIGLYALGESHINEAQAGVAKGEWGAHRWLRGYGTLPHPNVLAGLLGLTMLMAPAQKKARHLVPLLGMIITGSKTALAAALALKYRRIAIGLMFAVYIMARLTWPVWIQTETVQERMVFNDAAIQLIQAHPLLGTGWSTFPQSIQEGSERSLRPWQYQPAHNLALLMAAEWGIPLTGTALFLLLKQWKKSKNNLAKTMILLIAFTGIMDHYWLTLVPGLMMLALTVARLNQPNTHPSKSE